MRVPFVLVLGALLAALVGCTEGLRGVPMKAPDKTEGLRGVPVKAPNTTGKIVASATTSEREGLRVLWNGRTGGGDVKWKAWIAGSDEELAAVWRTAVVWRSAAAGIPPRIDFARYVVIAEAGEGGVCNPKIVGIEAEASGLLRLRFDQKNEICIMVATRIARIVAVPRRVLPTTLVFLHGYAFEVPQVPFG
jgi:hypothetical protein